MSTPHESMCAIGNVPMAPSRKKQRQEDFIFRDGPIDNILFPQLGGEITPLSRKKFPSIRPRQSDRHTEGHSSSSFTSFAAIEHERIRNPLIIVSTTAFDPPRLRLRTKGEEKEPYQS